MAFQLQDSTSTQFQLMRQPAPSLSIRPTPKNLGSQLSKRSASSPQSRRYTSNIPKTISSSPHQLNFHPHNRKWVANSKRESAAPAAPPSANPTPQRRFLILAATPSLLRTGTSKEEEKFPFMRTTDSSTQGQERNISTKLPPSRPPRPLKNTHRRHRKAPLQIILTRRGPRRRQTRSLCHLIHRRTGRSLRSKSRARLRGKDYPHNQPQSQPAKRPAQRG